MNSRLFKLGIYLGVGLTVSGTQLSLALPPPKDIPEEVLRTEIILEGRSPVNGQPLTASEYLQLEQQLAQSPYPPQLTPKVQQLIFLLRVRKLLKTFIPIL
ncbi:hypothetical protein [Gloeothece verrucosa]|uniref:Glutathione S-transferase n=1 Tax=Gloeothece verrucosa (strain PCC 7822) TaxID=497965 RepID=E0U7N4_GLOV7|nr:hypothetical protein [Gloeothece verrucosa]ADN14846.1 conserved hypothetical protein [Gloeothece verrucosa PCC 7822]